MDEAIIINDELESPEEHDIHASFWEHLQELRKTLIAVLIIVAVSTCLCFIFYQPILRLFGAPLEKLESQQIEEFSTKIIRNTGKSPFDYMLSSPKDGISHISIPPGGEIEILTPVKKNSLILLSPLEGISITLKICLWCGIILSSPLWLWLILQFIHPALGSQIKSLALTFLGLTQCFFGMGFLFAFWITLPLANQYLYAFNVEIGTNLWSLAHYFDYTILLLLANGLAAEISLILFYLVHLRIVSAEFLISKRRHAIVAAFVLGAILTPPDVLTQILMAIPLILFYEMAIIYAKLRSSYLTGT